MYLDEGDVALGGLVALGVHHARRLEAQQPRLPPQESGYATQPAHTGVGLPGVGLRLLIETCPLSSENGTYKTVTALTSS